MNSIFSQINMISMSLEQRIWNGFVQGTLALVLVYAICRVFRKLSPHAASWLWRLAYLKIMIAFVFLGSIHLPAMQHPSAKPAPVLINATRTMNHIGKITTTMPRISKTNNAKLALITIWCIGAAVCFIRLQLSLRRTRKLKRTCSNIDDNNLQVDLANLCRQMRIHRMPKLLTGDTSSPLIYGCIAPNIILPVKTLTHSSRDELRLILAHELAHIKRHDILWGWLSILVQCLLFFHPLVWLFHREWLFAQEAACDFLAMQTTGSTSTGYSKMLLNHIGRARVAGELVAGISEPYDTVKRRINTIMSFKTTSRKKQVVIGVAISFLALVGIIPWTTNAVKQKATTADIADAFARAVYSNDLETIHKLYPDEITNKEIELYPKPNNTSEWIKSHDAGWSDISSKLQNYGPIERVVLEAKGKILPGLAGKGLSTGSEFVPRPGHDISTWRVTAKNGEYRLGLSIKNRIVVGFTFNLTNMGIGGGGI